MMGKINVLSPQVAELIAAGEVVDRPASIVKELVENALDAGAKRITIEIRRGGVTYLRVTDDGCGIEGDDLPLAFIRHATSKVLTAADLEAIGTLGFRGEALPSISAVSHVKVTTRTQGSSAGHLYRAQGGIEARLEETGCAVGTSIEVRDLFYNTPARMKFLKKDITEGNAVASLLDRLALANPQVAFELIRDGKRTLQTPGDGDLLSAIRIVCGGDLAASMIPVSFENDGIAVSGFISRPSVGRATRTLQTFFINSRYVRSRTCTEAVEESYKNRLMGGRYPACVLNLTIDPSLVDVNVHPAKLEIRFSSERIVYNSVFGACVAALSNAEQKPHPPVQRISSFALDSFDHSGGQVSLTQPAEPLVLQDDTRLGALADLPLPPALAVVPVAQKPQPGRFAGRFSPDIECDDRSAVMTSSIVRNVPRALQTSLPDESLEVLPHCTALPEGETSSQPDVSYKVLGEIFDTYLLVEQDTSLLLIDKHAAHERYIYNRIRHLEKPEDRQIFLSPQAVCLSRDEYFALTEHPEALASLGIVAEDFGEGSLLVREIPMLLDGFPLNELLSETAAKVLACKANLTPSMLDELLYSVSCRAAVMAGRHSSAPEQQKLVEMVLGPDNIRHCPHGRPAVVTFAKRDIEKMFGRLG